MSFASSAAPAAASVPGAPCVVVAGLDFDYGSAAGGKPVLHGVSFSLPRGARMLLVGDNGAGKSSLLRVLAGRHIFKNDAVLVDGKHAFYNTSLNAERAYLSGDWGRRTVAFTGHGCALQADIGVSEMMREVQVAYAARRDMLVRLLGIDLTWRMHQLSDGQRRRVQIMLQLLRPSSLLLLDEITTDLDLITRQDFLAYIKSESETNGLTVVYATHIFDGLDDWATHIGYVADRTMADRAVWARSVSNSGIRPRSRTLKAVQEALLDDLVFPADIVGKRTRVKANGSHILRVILSQKEKTSLFDKTHVLAAVYSKLTNKPVVFEFASD